MIGNLEVSQIGMGCMGFSHGYGKAPSELDSIQAIYKAYKAGCTFFDTAESYGKEQFYSGHNEQLVGKAVESFRKKIILATNCIFIMMNSIIKKHCMILFLDIYNNL